MTAEAAAEALETALREIAAAALKDDCGFCWSPPGRPCITGQPGGCHVARFARAARHSWITSAEFALVLDALCVFTEASVLYPSGPDARTVKVPA